MFEQISMKSNANYILVHIFRSANFEKKHDFKIRMVELTRYAFLPLYICRIKELRFLPVIETYLKLFPNEKHCPIIIFMW